MRQLIAVALFCAGLFCIAQAQVPMTGAGLGAPGGAVAGCSPTACPGDVVSGAVAWWGLRAYSKAKAGTKVANICNSGDANCADINSLSTSGNFDVTTAQGAPLNCGGAGGTCTIKTLYDQIGANCSGACDVTNATAANRPTLTFNCLNTSLPCMAFALASSQVLQSAAGISSQSQPYTVSSVANLTNGGGGLFVMFGLSGVIAISAYDGANTVILTAGSGNNAAATAVTSSAHSIQAIFNGASSSNYVDGTSTAGGVNVGSNALSTDLMVGNWGFGGNFFDGKIAEVGVWDSDFSASSNANASAMCHNQFAYWATATSC